MPSKEEVLEALRQVEDPELGMDIVELGLLYDVEVQGPRVKVTHSLARPPEVANRAGPSVHVASARWRSQDSRRSRHLDGL
jgi:hypothetical protein